MKRLLKVLIAAILTAMFTIGCTPQDDPNNGGGNNGGNGNGGDNVNPDSEVVVTTYTPQDITKCAAKCGGDAVASPGISLSEIGVCWNREGNPTIKDSHRSTTNWYSPFVYTLSGLNPATVYHVRAYALRGLICYYGEEKTFTTLGQSHSYVDLGLPNGTLWATCNVGANTPEEKGYFTRWVENDYAIAEWGTDWRTPTSNEWRELLENATAVWTINNEVSGMRFTGSNGNSIFLPAAGYGGHYTSGGWATVISSLNKGYYWSSTPSSSTRANSLHFSTDNLNLDTDNVDLGLCVRPIYVYNN